MDVNGTLKEGGRAGHAIRGRYLSGVLVAVEMTLAMVLLAGAGVMMRSFLWAYNLPAGVDTSNIITMRMELPSVKADKPEKILEFQRLLRERLRSLPGVENAAIAASPAGNSPFDFPCELEGKPSDPEHRLSVGFQTASDGYFETLRLVALRGRVLHAADQNPGPPVTVINQAMAKYLWPNEDPIGKRLRIFKNNVPGEWITVLGLTANVLQSAQRKDPQPVAVIPIRQETRPWMSVIARTRGNAESLANAFRREVQAIDPDLPVHDVSTMDTLLAMSRWPLRVFGIMFTIFAGIALLLATVGLYAVVAYGVNQRRQEIGVRVALGASGRAILRMVIAGGMKPAAIGLALGLAAAFGVTRVLSTLLVGVSPTDPLTFGTVAALLLLSAILGCTIPARRAMRVDPAIALRHE
jgi:putative ABC transport system permease protein